MKVREILGADGVEHTVTSCLNLNKEHQILRLVNATGSKTVFAFEPNLVNNEATSLSITPSTGVLEPGDFTHVRIKNLDYPKRPVDSITLVFRYKRLGLYEGETARVTGKINLEMKAQRNEHGRQNVIKDRLIWRVFRAILLIALIAYNVVLIKYEIFSSSSDG